MSRRAVRTAITAYLQGIPGITNMYRDAPWQLLGDDWAQQASGIPGTPAFVHIAKQAETRQTVPAVIGGQKSVMYDVSVMVLYQYVIPAAPTDKVVWVDALDDLLDAIVGRIRADPTLGTGAGGVVWAAGETENGIEVASDLPQTHNGVVLAWNRVDFKVREIVQA
jgi:hypothetical protein